MEGWWGGNDARLGHAGPSLWVREAALSWREVWETVFFGACSLSSEGIQQRFRSFSPKKPPLVTPANLENYLIQASGFGCGQETYTGAGEVAHAVECLPCTH